MRKTTSSNFANQQFLFTECALNYALGLISGRWKAQLLQYVAQQERTRFSEFKAALPAIADQVLGRQLRELEAGGLLQRIELTHRGPAHVEYALTPKGRSLWPILQSLCEWGRQHAPQPTCPLAAQAL